jgi:hypothetical protein
MGVKGLEAISTIEKWFEVKDGAELWRKPDYSRAFF